MNSIGTIVIYFNYFKYLSQGSNSVSVDLLTYGDLESLRNQQHHRTGFGTQHIPGAKTRSQLHSKRYLIMTYTVEFDRLGVIMSHFQNNLLNIH